MNALPRPVTRFETCVAFVLRMEGGYVDDPNDPGGPTNKGITQREFDRWRAARGEQRSDVRDLQLPEAEAIYRAWYWEPIRGDELGAPLDLAVMDFAVNSGVVRAALALQEIVDAAKDGNIGPLTLAAVRAWLDRRVSSPPPIMILATRLCAERESFDRSIAKGPLAKFFATEWLPRLAYLRAEIAKTSLTQGAPNG